MRTREVKAVPFVLRGAIILQKSVKKYRPRQIHYARLERGRHFLVVRQRVKVEGVHRRWPQLYILVPDGVGDITMKRDERLQEFFLDNDGRSYQWMLDVARSIGLFVDHSMAVASDPALRSARRSELERRLLRGFAFALRDGTSVDIEGTRIDATKLYWSTRGRRRAHEILKKTTRYMEWLGDVDPSSRWARAATTKGWKPDPLTAYRLAAELALRKKRALLGHLEGKGLNAPHRFGGIVDRGEPATNLVPSFPSSYAVPLLFVGFKRSDDDWDETAELIAHLLVLQGLRQSEAFHLFVSDVQFVNGSASIYFHHPQWGKIEARGGGFITRQEYLAGLGRTPRNLIKDRFWAGWKGMAEDDVGTPGFFLPIDPLVKRTTELLKRYLFVTRPALMARRPKWAGDHPYLFVSTGRTAGSGGGQIGDPYTISAFRSAWKSAIRRLAQIYQDSKLRVRKAEGTSPHGCRHFYGRFLWTAGVEGEIIQRCMHHRSVESHRVYTRLQHSEISDLLNRYSAGQSRTESFRAMHATISAMSKKFSAFSRDFENDSL
ncbi:site-specific integrase [Rhizobium ruizarguesonis]|nr:site-specific integrase [Rhizobium ruizarguesonis]TBD17995.1 site-specific integrase [Rhizobium ruizarguesonis]TBE99238.1 site-specific integrase [Rhizobium ruizarguesonis]